MTNPLQWITVALGVSLADRSAAAPGGRVFDYFHAEGDATIHGTISNLDGAVRSRWTVTRGRTKDTFDQALDDDAFRSVLAGFELPELRRHEVVRKNQRLDFVRYQVVWLIELEDDGAVRKRRTFLVPAAAPPPRIAEWLQAAQIPAVR